MKLYLSFPITGHDLKERRQYAARTCAMLHVERPDDIIINPFTIADKVLKKKMERTHTLDPPTYEEYMAADLKELATCQLAIFAPGWQASEGCKMEMAMCKDKNIEVKFIHA